MAKSKLGQGIGKPQHALNSLNLIQPKLAGKRSVVAVVTLSLLCLLDPLFNMSLKPDRSSSTISYDVAERNLQSAIFKISSCYIL